MTSTLATPRRILVVRNDKLGDFVLALPSFALLKQALPSAEICALVPEYTREVADLAPGIDRVLIDPGSDSPSGSAMALARAWRAEEFDALIALFTTSRIGLAGWRARIPHRLSPATKLAQVFFDDRVRQRRSQSTQPEYEYNLDLARHYLRGLGAPIPDAPARPVLAFAAEAVADEREALCNALALEPGRKLVFIHAGSGGSANNLDLEQYAELASAVQSAAGHQFVLTAGPGEGQRTRELAARIQGAPVVVFESTGGLGAFARTLATADVFVGGSTGPLHLAGALDRPTVGFYPRRPTSSPLRWQTLSGDRRRLAYAPEAPADERDMSAVDVLRAARELSERFLD